MFALGILLMSRLQSFRDLSHILFGNILGVQSQELWLMTGVALVVLVVLVLFHKELELTSFDSTHAEVIGIQSNRLRTMLLILLAFTVVTGIQVVGVVLTSALLVTPAAAASLITSDLRRMMVVSAVIGAGSAFVGLLLSYYFAVSTGAAIVLTCTAVFGMIVLINWVRQR
jgi:manganese/iron transport system permease protein